jgi:adenylate kinase
VRLILVGPPGAGKGTQAAVVADRLGVPHISTGEIFRGNVARGTELGQAAQRYLDAGHLVPDEVTNAMVRDRLGEQDALVGFLMDGYPRNLAQVAFLEGVLSDQGVRLDAVVELAVDREVIMARLLERATREGRADDTEDVVRHRFDVYDAETAPIVAYYAEASLLRRVAGEGSVAEVTSRVLTALGV